MIDFGGKRAFVTGGGRGIGRGIAIRLAELGAEVYAVSRTKADLDSLERENPSIKTIVLDISDWEKTRKVVDDLAPIHLLVNNAGIGRLDPVLEAKPEDFDLLFNVNVKAVINITQAMAKGLIARKEKGCVVNVSSQASQRTIDGLLLYCSTKAALDMVTKSFARELGPKQIRVNAVNPTVVLTTMGKEFWSDPDKVKNMTSRIPQGRFAEVHEIANAVVFLLSDQSEMVNGHTLPVDGGYLVT